MGDRLGTLGAVGISLLYVGSIPRELMGKVAFSCFNHHIHAKHTLSIDTSDDLCGLTVAIPAFCRAGSTVLIRVQTFVREKISTLLFVLLLPFIRFFVDAL